MIKKALFVFVTLFFFQSTKAQQKTASDTTIYYRDHNGNITNKEHVEDVIFIMPADSSSGKKLYPVKVYYLDGTLKLVGASNVLSSKPVLDGTSISYFSNGNKQSVNNYKDGVLAGEQTCFYTNGKLESVEKYDKRLLYLVAFYDTIGNALTQNGNGKWINTVRLNNWKTVNEGPVKNGLQDGEWHEAINDTEKYVTVYKEGTVLSSTDPNQELGEHVYTQVDQEPTFKNGGAKGFNEYLIKNIVFPLYDRQNNIEGRVIITYIVEKDGSLSNVKALRGPDHFIKDEAVRVIKLCPAWIPGMEDGQPVRTQFTVQFAFALKN